MPSTRTPIRAIASGSLILLLGVSCQQPKMFCSTAHGTYAAKYELKSGDANSLCGGFKGDILGMQTYFATGGINGTPKFNDPSVAIRSQYAGLAFEGAQFYPIPVPGLVDDPKDNTDYDHMPNALGDFDSGDPDAEDFCHAKTVGPAVVALPELPLIPGSPEVPDDPATPDVDESMPAVPDVPATPPLTIRHEWTNARWLVNADAQGTQFEADLKFTQDGCTAEYHVIGVYPSIPCTSDDDCGDGSGLNPDFALKCDTSFEDVVNAPDEAAIPDDPETPEDDSSPAVDWGVCVLSRDLPSYE